MQSSTVFWFNIKPPFKQQITISPMNRKERQTPVSRQSYVSTAGLHNTSSFNKWIWILYLESGDCESCWTLSDLLFFFFNHCLPATSVWQPPLSQRWCVICMKLARLRCVDVSSVSVASEWELHATCSMVWNWRGGREKAAEMDGVRGRRGWNRKGDWGGRELLFAEGTLQGQPEHICEEEWSCSLVLQLKGWKQNVK